MATSYTKTTWVNNSAPAISATNLNNIEDFNAAIASGGSGGVVNSDKLEGYNTTTTNKVWVGGVNDGNGGQPPEPKSRIDASKGIGSELAGQINSGSPIYYSGSSSATGTWVLTLFWKDGTNPPGIYIGSGTVSASATTNYYYLAKRIS